jgi:hypothetical protein
VKLVLDFNIYCDYAEGIPNVVDYFAMVDKAGFSPAAICEYNFSRIYSD